MHELCIVACSKSKIWDRNPDAGPTEAREAYVGTLARLAMAYAQKYCDRWLILSAKYGFLNPSDKVPGPYDVTFKRRRGAITVEELRRQAMEMGILNHREVVVLGGRDYVNAVKLALPHIHVVSPLSGYRGIGAMVRALRESIERNKPLSDPLPPEGRGLGTSR